MHKTSKPKKSEAIRTMSQAEQVVALRRGIGRAGRIFTPKGSVYSRKEKFGRAWE